MKFKNDSGITLLILVLTIIIMLILFVVTVGSFNTSIFNDIKEVQQNSEELKSIQDKEIENVINGLGGLDE